MLLPDTTLVRRRDHVEVIGAALEARAAGAGYRRIARFLGRDCFTVRGWLRAFARVAEALRMHFTRWAYALDAMLPPIEPTADRFADAVAAIGVAARAVVQLHGPRPAWSVAARLSGGGLLCNTSYPLPRGW